MIITNRNCRAFTVIELMVVVCIIAIIVGLCFSGVRSVERQRQKDKALEPQLSPTATLTPQAVPLVKEYSTYPGNGVCYEILVDKATGTRVLCVIYYSNGVALLALPSIPAEVK